MHKSATGKIIPFVIIATLLITSHLNAAQTNLFTTTDDQPVNKDSVYMMVEKVPEFPGGDKALISFLKKNINYPSRALKDSIQGKVVVQFIVDKKGKVQQPKVIKSVDENLDKEALQVVGKMPNWIPGEQNGEKVAVYRIVPVVFSTVWEPNEKTLVVLDGVKMPLGFDTEVLSVGKLISLKILKPEPEAERKRLIDTYGKEAAGGVILITTNKNEIYYALADSVVPAGKPDCKEDFKMPEFPGGTEKMLTYIADSIRYPFVAKELKKEGTVIVRFKVDKGGKLSEIKVMKQAEYFLDKEALRVIGAMPDWIPGGKCDEKMNVYVTMPVNFRLDLPATERQWEKNNKTIILFNGIRLPSSFDVKLLRYDKLTSYKVFQPSTKEVTKNLISKYGKDAINGVIVIESK